jgi:hypothetical protein
MVVINLKLFVKPHYLQFSFIGFKVVAEAYRGRYFWALCICMEWSDSMLCRKKGRIVLWSL